MTQATKEQMMNEIVEKMENPRHTPKYCCPYCGSRELYVAAWVRMNPPVGETLDLVGDVSDSKTSELLPAYCQDCHRDIHGVDYLPDKEEVTGSSPVPPTKTDAH